MLKNLVLLFSFLMGATNVWALIDGQGLYGVRQYSVKDASDNNVSIRGNATTLAVHFDPIPFVPISAGFTYMSVSLGTDSFPGSPAKADISELGVEASVWIPMVPVVTPYAKVRVVIDSKLNVEGGSADSEATLTGTHLSLGVAYPILPLVGIVLELSQAFQEIDSYAGKVQSFNSQSVALGIKVGI